MASKVVGCVRMVRPMYFDRLRIMMQSYEGTISVRRKSRSLRPCSSSETVERQLFCAVRWLYTEATIRRASNDCGAMCIEKELRDSTKSCTMTVSLEEERTHTKNAQLQRSVFFLRAFRTKTGVRHVVAARHHNRTQVSTRIDDIDSLVTLGHWDTETAVVASPFLDDVTANFPNHLNQPDAN